MKVELETAASLTRQAEDRVGLGDGQAGKMHDRQRGERRLHDGGYRER